MQKPSYSELLRDPRWQRKRLEVLQRDSFTCLECGAADKALHVHHGYYRNGKMPWEYPTSSLHTLCEDCHQYETDSLLDEKRTLCNALAEIGFRTGDFLAISMQLWEHILKHDVRLRAKDLSHGIQFLIEELSAATGGKTNSVAATDLPTGEGSNAGEAAERKSDAIV